MPSYRYWEAGWPRIGEGFGEDLIYKPFSSPNLMSANKGAEIVSTPAQDDILSESESLSKLTKACEGCVGDESCCAIVGLKKAGWTVNLSDGITHDGRKGIVISLIEPAKNGQEK